MVKENELISSNNSSLVGAYDYYLDKNGNPCPRGSNRSHLSPGEYENLLKGIKNDS